jgi:hypothetical protein
MHIDTARACKGVGAGAAGKKGLHHRRGNLGRILRNTRARQPMVGRTNEQRRTPALRHMRVPDHAELDGQILDAPQRTRWLGLRIDLSAKRRFERPVDRNHILAKPCEIRRDFVVVAHAHS